MIVRVVFFSSILYCACNFIGYLNTRPTISHHWDRVCQWMLFLCSEYFLVTFSQSVSSTTFVLVTHVPLVRFFQFRLRPKFPDRITLCRVRRRAFSPCTGYNFSDENGSTGLPNAAVVSRLFFSGVLAVCCNRAF